MTCPKYGKKCKAKNCTHKSEINMRPNLDVFNSGSCPYCSREIGHNVPMTPPVISVNGKDVPCPCTGKVINCCCRCNKKIINHGTVALCKACNVNKPLFLQITKSIFGTYKNLPHFEYDMDRFIVFNLKVPVNESYRVKYKLINRIDGIPVHHLDAHKYYNVSYTSWEVVYA